MALDDIIEDHKADKASNANTNDDRPTRGSSSCLNNRSFGPTRNQRGSRMYKSPHTPALHNVSDGSKIQISNLGQHVSQEDLKCVFATRVGPLKRVILNYDQYGRPAGSALLHFTKAEDAARAMRNFSGVPLDGRPMRIELVIASIATRAIPPFSAIRRSLRHNMNDGEINGATTDNRLRIHSQRKDKRTMRIGRGGRGGRGSRGGQGCGRSTTEELDAELSNYMHSMHVNN